MSGRCFSPALLFVPIPPYVTCVLSAEASSLLSGTAHDLHPLSNDLVDLEELCAASVDTDSLALEKVAFSVSVGGRVGLDALGVTSTDETVAKDQRRSNANEEHDS